MRDGSGDFPTTIGTKIAEGRQVSPKAASKMAWRSSEKMAVFAKANGRMSYECGGPRPSRRGAAVRHPSHADGRRHDKGCRAEAAAAGVSGQAQSAPGGIDCRARGGPGGRF